MAAACAGASAKARQQVVALSPNEDPGKEAATAVATAAMEALSHRMSFAASLV
eukprot:CAMPEP_0115710534 /NCGR_PEP_ID=MMETSP0272-20121206/73063_1 /TAXON_ID=71861 /ORGANISM="Scrippsiella trochoidea, Strain CCMP3099" /LENGTH=52 /DNA_ID=CAMNT_0003152231 /DNA_START=228 /DNA_END=383 /DNA_ORIENTATION=+